MQWIVLITQPNFQDHSCPVASLLQTILHPALCWCWMQYALIDICFDKHSFNMSQSVILIHWCGMGAMDNLVGTHRGEKETQNECIICPPSLPIRCTWQDFIHQLWDKPSCHFSFWNFCSFSFLIRTLALWKAFVYPVLLRLREGTGQFLWHCSLKREGSLLAISFYSVLTV